MDEPMVEIRRSTRRRRTVSAYRRGDTVVVLMPAGLSAAQERKHVDTLLARLAKSRTRERRTDAALAERADTLRRLYLPEAPEPSSIRFVDNQLRRWGSCTVLDRSIRLTSRLAGMPGWVLDYVIVHELAHLIETDHNARFDALVARYPRTERAIGYLDGYDVGSAAAAPARAAGSVDGSDGDGVD
jgi:predicted metal-dependent hydrolase